MGPYATQILARLRRRRDQGRAARGRRHAPRPGRCATPAWAASSCNTNRNKRSVVLDLKKPGGARGLPARIAKSADVLVYNIRPQAMARLKLSYEDVRAVNPKIIYVGCFGFSQRGPYAAKAAYDDLIQGAAGVAVAAAEAGRRRAALRAGDRRRPLGRAARRQRGLRGAVPPREDRQGPARRRADVREPAADRARRPHGRLHLRAAARASPATTACSRRTAAPTQTKDGYVCVLVYNDKQWRRSSTSSAGRRCSRDPQFATQEARSKNYARPTPSSPRR